MDSLSIVQLLWGVTCFLVGAAGMKTCVTRAANRDAHDGRILLESGIGTSTNRGRRNRGAIASRTSMAYCIDGNVTPCPNPRSVATEAEFDLNRPIGFHRSESSRNLLPLLSRSARNSQYMAIAADGLPTNVRQGIVVGAAPNNVSISRDRRQIVKTKKMNAHKRATAPVHIPITKAMVKDRLHCCCDECIRKRMENELQSVNIQMVGESLRGEDILNQGSQQTKHLNRKSMCCTSRSAETKKWVPHEPAKSILKKSHSGNRQSLEVSTNYDGIEKTSGSTKRVRFFLGSDEKESEQ